MSFHYGFGAASALAMSLALATGAYAHDPATTTHDVLLPAAASTQSAPAKLSPVIVTGTRVTDRTEASSLTPIDVIPARVLEQTGTQSLTRALERATPSLNFPQNAFDLFFMSRSFEMRGLAPDEALLLVNGKRWHPSPILTTLGYVGQGSQSVDLNTIPMAAIDHIEVLRDGASAQYGSDAIAGVVNIVLKGGTHDNDVQLLAGEYSAGDGRQWQTSASFGIPLGGRNDWLRISAQLGNQDPTNRAEPDRRVGAPPGVYFHYGSGLVHNKNLFLNGQYQVADNVRVYAFGHFSKQYGVTTDNFRYGASTALANSPVIGEIFPDGNGFQPLNQAVSFDKSLVVGVRGHTRNGWRWDVSGNYGGDRVSYTLRNTVNYAYFVDFGFTPRRFHDGILNAPQTSFDVDLSKELDENWTLSFGGQYLRQGYRVRPGGKPSWYVGDSGVQGGAQGFPGWSPDEAVNVHRHDFSEYAQLEGNLTGSLSLSLAARHEQYSDFGSTVSGALSARYDFDDGFALRATASTGFRAPALAQEYYTDVTLVHEAPGNALGVPEGLYRRGLVPVGNTLAQLLGAQALKPEKSRSFTAGVVWNPGAAWSTSVDAYTILVRNRIALSSDISLTQPNVLAYLADHGVAHPDFTALNYFTNAGNVRVTGVGWVTTYSATFANDDSLTSTVSFAYHKNKVVKVNPNPAVLEQFGDVGFERLTRTDIEGLLANSIPRSKFIWTNTYRHGPWGAVLTATRYGGFTMYSATDYHDDVVYPYQWIFDLSGSYSHGHWRYTVGADNVLNNYPRKVPAYADARGVFPYPPASPFGFNGAYVYASARYRW